MKNKTNFFIILGVVLLLSIGVTYAIFSLEVIGTGKENAVTTGTLSLEYKDGAQLVFEKMFPGDAISKTITIENTGTLDTAYNINLINLVNTIVNDEIEITLTCNSYSNYGKDNQTSLGECTSLTDYPISYTKNMTEKRIMENIAINSGVTHVYTVEVEFVNLGEDVYQNYNQNKTFSAMINVEEYREEYSIQGKLVDASGNAITGATIEVHSDVVSAKTGSQGNYRLEGLVEGSHELIIKNSSGTEIAREDIKIIKGEEYGVNGRNITLDEDKHGILKIIVEGDNGVSIENIKPTCIFNNGATPSVGDVYTDVNGIYTYIYKQAMMPNLDTGEFETMEIEEDGWR